MLSDDKIQKTLWTDSNRTRFFAIPSGEELPPGEFLIRTVTGRQQSIDLSVVVQYELSKEEATEWLTAQLTQVVNQGKDAIIGFFERKRAALWETETAPKTSDRQSSEEPGSGNKPGEPGPGVSFFSALTGEPVEALQNDPDAISRGVRKALNDLKEFFEAATSPDPARVQDARYMAHAFSTILRNHDIKVSDEVEQIPDKLRQIYYSSDQPDQLLANATKLYEMADFIERSSSVVIRKLREQAANLRRKADAVE
jgi:hypothetical protein